MQLLLEMLKKRKVSSYISILMLAFPVFLYMFADKENRESAMVDGLEQTLVIDAGHGGVDSGAVAADGSKESDINLAIALKLRALAEFYGQENIMLRQDDSTLSDGTAYSEHRDLERRAEITNSVGECIYFSIHQNFYPTGQPSGSLVIYASGEESERLGRLTHQNLIQSLNPDNRRMAEPALDNYYVLSKLSCPAILVECGFMSNFSEMEKLKTSEYQTALASVLMSSFLQYTQTNEYI